MQTIVKNSEEKNQSQMDSERRQRQANKINTLDCSSSKRRMTNKDEHEGVRLDIEDCSSDSENSII